MARKTTVGALALPFTDTHAAPTGQTFVGIDGARATVEAPTLLDALAEPADPAPMVSPDDHMHAMWAGTERGYSEAQVLESLAEHERDLAALNAGTLRPERVIGRGVRKPKTVARAWLTARINEDRRDLATGGFLNVVNRGNAAARAVETGHPLGLVWRTHRITVTGSTEYGHLWQPTCTCGWKVAGFVTATHAAYSVDGHMREESAQ